MNKTTGTLVSDLFVEMVQKNDALVKPALDTLKQMYSKDEYARDVFHKIRIYFLGTCQNENMMALNNAFSIEIRKRFRFLYALDRLIQQEPSFQSALFQIKKEMDLKNTDSVDGVFRRMAFLWAAIERQKQR